MGIKRLSDITSSVKIQAMKTLSSLINNNLEFSDFNIENHMEQKNIHELWLNNNCNDWLENLDNKEKTKIKIKDLENKRYELILNNNKDKTSERNSVQRPIDNYDDNIDK